MVDFPRAKTRWCCGRWPGASWDGGGAAALPVLVGYWREMAASGRRGAFILPGPSGIGQRGDGGIAVLEARRMSFTDLTSRPVCLVAVKGWVWIGPAIRSTGGRGLCSGKAGGGWRPRMARCCSFRSRRWSSRADPLSAGRGDSLRTAVGELGRCAGVGRCGGMLSACGDLAMAAYAALSSAGLLPRRKPRSTMRD